MKRRKQIEFIEWLDDKGFGIFIEVQADGSDGEYILARACIDEDELMLWEEIMTTTHMPRIIKAYQHQLETDKSIIMDVRESLQGLSIKQLKSLLPSYYQLAIEARIKELQEKNEAAKVKRSRKKPVKTSD